LAGEIAASLSDHNRSRRAETRVRGDEDEYELSVVSVYLIVDCKLDVVLFLLPDQALSIIEGGLAEGERAFGFMQLVQQSL